MKELNEKCPIKKNFYWSTYLKFELGKVLISIKIDTVVDQRLSFLVDPNS